MSAIETPTRPLARPDSPGLRERLRRATAADHAALEALMPLATGAATTRAYRDHLQFLLAYHRPLESLLAGRPVLRRWLPDLSRRWKAALLEQDLAGHATADRPDLDVPVPATDAHALGMLYVNEGAQLGARVVLGRLREAGVIPGPIGSRYLEAYGAEHGVMWRRFTALLGRVPPAAHADVAAGARQAFATLIAGRAVWVPRW